MRRNSVFSLLFSIILSIFWMVSPALSALELSSAYAAEVPAPAQGITQNELIQQAFKSVLVRLSGSEKIVTSAGAEKALANIDAYVEQFAYHESPAKERFLRVQFSEGKTAALVKQSGAPLMDESRPQVLVWALVSENNAAHWMAEDHKTATNELKVAAKRFGIPLVFPLFDLMDTSLISEEHLRNHQFDLFREASKRYNAKVIWLGNLSKSDSGWTAEWSLLSSGGNDALSWKATNPAVDQLMTESMQSLTSRIHEMASSDNIQEDWNENKEDNFDLSIKGIEGFDQYTQILSYLKQLPQVSRVEVLKISPTLSLFHLEAKATRQSILREIDKASVLVKDDAPDANDHAYKVIKVLQ